MDSLTEDVFDVVLAGTGLTQSLLALSLSRSGKKVLHLDRNSYYGSSDAALSLTEIDAFVNNLHSGSNKVFSDATCLHHDGHSRLAASRTYNLSLRPQIIYAKSAFLPSLVASKIASQLEFVAVGGWWVLRKDGLHKIPSTREDVFSDESLSVRDKRALMKFLRFVLQDDPDEDNPDNRGEKPGLGSTLFERLEEFKIPVSLHSAVQALALSSKGTRHISADRAVKDVRRHLQSIGHLGPFPAVVAKYGSNSEITQVACRAQAVGGGIYLLGHGIKSVAKAQTDVNEGSLLVVELSDSTRIRTRRVIGGVDDLPSGAGKALEHRNYQRTIHSISIVASPLKSLFPTIENAPTPAVTIILVEADDIANTDPIYLQVHSEDTGECASGQSIIYASVRQEENKSAQDLQNAVESFLTHVEEAKELRPEVLFNFSYTSRGLPDVLSEGIDAMQMATIVEVPPFELAVEDNILTPVQTLWRDLIGLDADNETFLRFEAREQEESEDNGG